MVEISSVKNSKFLFEPTIPKGPVLVTYPTYKQAQKAVDFLADNNFPVESVSIVGNDLKLVERVTGRLTYPRVAGAGAASGAWLGLFVGIILSFFDGRERFLGIFVPVLLGVAFGVFFGIASYALSRSKKDFTSTSQVVASSYMIVVSEEQFASLQTAFKDYPDRGVEPVLVPAEKVSVDGKVDSGFYADLPDGQPKYGKRSGEVSSVDKQNL